jgi:hypothetical protein
METLDKTVIVLAGQKIETFTVTDKCHTRVVILHRGLWEKGYFLLLCDPMFDAEDGHSDVQEDGIPGYTVDVVTCDGSVFNEWTLFETTDNRSPFELARIVADALVFIDTLPWHEFVSRINDISVCCRHLKRRDGGFNCPDPGLSSWNGSFYFEVRTKEDEPNSYKNSYIYEKSVFDVIMETATALLAPLNLGL